MTPAAVPSWALSEAGSAGSEPLLLALDTPSGPVVASHVFRRGRFPASYPVGHARVRGRCDDLLQPCCLLPELDTFSWRTRR